MDIPRIFTITGVKYPPRKILPRHAGAVRWLEANPNDDFAQEVREQLRTSPGRHVTFTREYLAWGVFALMQR